MNHFDPTSDGPPQEGDQAPPRALNPSPNDATASPSSSTAAPLRGEIFDVVIGENGEIETPDAARKKGAAWFVAGLAALFCAYSAGAYVGQNSKAPAPSVPFSSQNEATERATPLRVQIAGLVKKPGVYTLQKGARIEDALRQAGGPLAGADLSALNLADWAADGSKIDVPAKRKFAALATPTPQIIIKKVFVTLPQNPPADKLSETAARETDAPKSRATSVSKRATSSNSKSKAIPSQTETGGKSSDAALELLRKNPVDLNRAGAQQLATLPGVGPKMAERILLYRQENGAFKSIDDLDNVRGIGEKRLETLRELVKVR